VRAVSYGVRVGILYYGESAEPIGIADRALAHLKVVIATKLRRSESLTLTWQHRHDDSARRSVIWLHPAIPLRFVFDDPEPAVLDSQWIQELVRSANSSRGITLTAEHVDTMDAPRPDQASRVASARNVHIEELSIDQVTVARDSLAKRDPLTVTESTPDADG
jgi:hypothetical protein